MRGLFRIKYRIVTLVSLAFLTQCCCIVIPFGVSAQRELRQQEVRQQEVWQQVVEQAGNRLPLAREIMERIEAGVVAGR